MRGTRRGSRDRLRVQASGAGTAPRHLSVGARTSGTADGARRLLLRQHVLGRVRDRGDPPRPDPRDRDPRVRLRAPDLGRDRPDRGDPDLLVPPDDQGLPDRGRGLHRHEGQPGAAPSAARRCRPARGLRPDRERLDGGRRPSDQLGRSPGRPAPHRLLAGVRLDDRLREPPWGAGVRQDLRGADVPVHRQPGSHVRDGDLPGRVRPSPAVPDPAAGRERGDLAVRRSRHGVHLAPGVRVRRSRGDGCRSDLERGPGVPQARVAQRPDHPRVDGLDPRDRRSSRCRSWPPGCRWSRSRTRASRSWRASRRPSTAPARWGGSSSSCSRSARR